MNHGFLPLSTGAIIDCYLTTSYLLVIYLLMAHLSLNAERMLAALQALDTKMQAPSRLIVGGGAAMVLAYDHPLATQDVDAFCARGGLRMADLDQMAKAVAAELDIEPDWLNAHFETFTGVLPNDYANRLRNIFQGTHLCADALGPEDLLIMKCFAGRDKDLPHARRLLRIATDLGLVDRHLSALVDRRYPKAGRAADYFDDLRDDEGL